MFQYLKGSQQGEYICPQIGENNLKIADEKRDHQSGRRQTDEDLQRHGDNENMYLRHGSGDEPHRNTGQQQGNDNRGADFNGDHKHIVGIKDDFLHNEVAGYQL